MLAGVRRGCVVTRCRGGRGFVVVDRGRKILTGAGGGGGGGEEGGGRGLKVNPRLFSELGRGD